MVVIFPAALKVTGAGGEPRDGSLIRAYTPDGQCVGEFTWARQKAYAFPIWGDDPMTEVKDGAEAGDAIQFRLRPPEDGPDVPLTLGSGEAPRFETDAIVIAEEIAVGVAEPEGQYGFGEAGTVRVVLESKQQVHRVELKQRYRVPVVLLHISAINGGDPVTVQVRHTRERWFEFEVQARFRPHARYAEKVVSYLVVEQGTHRLANGALLQAGLVGATEKRARITFAQPFRTAPVVFSQLVSNHDSTSVLARQSRITRSGFDLYLQTAAARGRSGLVGWVAVEPGGSDHAKMPYEVGLLRADERQWVALRFQSGFESSVAFQASVQTEWSGGLPMVQSEALDSAGVRLRLLKEPGADGKPTDGPEMLGYLAVGHGLLEATPSTAALQMLETSSEAVEAVTASVEGPGAGVPPRVTALLGNYPNPFVEHTSIVYDLARETRVRLVVFDLIGREVARLVDHRQEPGRYTVSFDRSGLPSGLYFCRLDTDESTHTVAMVSVK